MKINQALLDEVTRIKVNILQKRDRNLKSIMVTSANRKEGTSTVAANLALSIGLGEKDRVLLVDTNVRQPILHAWFGLEQQHGFIDLAIGRKRVPEVIKDTTFPNIRIITAGFFPPGENKLDILSGITPETKQAIEDGFDWVVYDSSPVNIYPDTLMLSPLADGVVLVILAESTRRAAVKKVKDSLKSINANILGGVLNGRRYVVPKFIYKRM
ncbi:MAG: CpsD/CapB family tyrosine-protein kinase [Thermodesulfobacteriota bacterium]